MVNLHKLELLVDGQNVDLTEDFDVRMNNVFYQPQLLVTTSATYSFSFELLATPTNNKILGYSNNISVPNKFSRTYNAVVLADGIELFEGELVLSSVNEESYSCNLVIPNEFDLETIFGEATLSQAEWWVPYSGATTINSVNADSSKKYYFPLVSYGAFQKKPESVDEISANYTSKFVIDNYNRFYYNTFMPSLNVAEEMRKLFEWKDYVVKGNIFNDPILSNIYASTNLASDQADKWNLGNPMLGSVSLSWSFTSSTTNAITQDLDFPIYRLFNPYKANSNFSDTDAVFNFDKIDLWNMLTDNNTVTLTQSPNYLYNKEEMCIVAPADGWYKVNFSVNARLLDNGGNITATQNVTDFSNGDASDAEQRQITTQKELKYFCPFEIQLVKNYDNNIELIKGANNIIYATGDPNEETFRWRSNSGLTNYYEWQTAFPHEALFASIAPTKKDGVQVKATQANTNSITAIESSSDSKFGGGASGRNRGGTSIPTTWEQVQTSERVLGYLPTNLLAYDPIINSDFICGFSSLGNGTASVIKDGRSWSKLSSEKGESFANVYGYRKSTIQNGSVTYVNTNYNTNSYKDSSSFVTINGDEMNGQIQCCVYLNKNDRLEPMLIQRNLGNTLLYNVQAACSLSVTAMSERDEDKLREDANWGYNSETEFPELLNLFNFTNQETQISTWIKNVCNAFNLIIRQNGNVITIDKNASAAYSTASQDAFIDIDNRVMTKEATASPIDYPSKIGVTYAINQDEFGFEQTVPREYLSLKNWYDYGFSGSTLIVISTEATEEDVIDIPFSYTYYYPWYFENDDYTLEIPVIEESRYMVDVLFGDTYEEALKHDGMSLPQRFWFRGSVVEGLEVNLASDGNESVAIATCKNANGDFTLAYTIGTSLLSLFNWRIDPSAESVQIECYLSPVEYQLLLGGANVKFDGERYKVIEIEGYSPKNLEKTTLTLLRQ